MLTKLDATRAYELVLDKLIEYEDAYNIHSISGEVLHQYEHLKSMAEYLSNSLILGSEEVLLNTDEVDSLVRDIVLIENIKEE